MFILYLQQLILVLKRCNIKPTKLQPLAYLAWSNPTIDMFHNEPNTHQNGSGLIDNCT